MVTSLIFLLVYIYGQDVDKVITTIFGILIPHLLEEKVRMVA